ncbi:hypothetical protein ABW20_dc0109007 [Dactylellina cionopaga]|nr:hypothetical protein ABW20_dc0109007 [Dactylellina cionopaga]
MSTSQPIHPSRVANLPTSQQKKYKKKQPLKAPKPQPASTSLTRSQLRKKVRDITRLLNASSTSTSGGSGGTPANHHPSKLSATARLDHERALAAYKHELSAQQFSIKREQLSKRYHKVRFFERRKATRALSRLNRQLSSSPQSEEKEMEELRQKVHEAEVDLNYIVHYPGLEKYISLYKTGDDKATNQKRERIRKDVEKRMEEGTLEKGDALIATNAAEGFGGSDGNMKSSKNAKRGKDHVQEDRDDEESDGGFFEV